MQRYKRPESVLVVIYSQPAGQILMMQRKDDPDFWQSVTGSLEEGEQPYQTAIREVLEETGIDIIQQGLTLVDGEHSVVFQLFQQFRNRYAPGVTENLEHWFFLAVPDQCKIILTEHLDYQWVSLAQAVNLTKSWNNRQAIERLQTDGLIK